jgi:hypothetical protein
MRYAAYAFAFCFSMLLPLTTMAAPADSKAAPTGSKPDSSRARANAKLNPQVTRNSIDSTTVSWTDAMKESQTEVKRLLTKVLQATPKPTAPYAPSEESPSDEVAAKAGMVKGTQRWVPIEAWTQREYEAVGPEEDEDAAVKFLEIQIALNGTRGLTSGIATKSDKPHMVTIDGAVAVEQTSIPVVDSTQAQVDPSQQPDEPMTLLRLYFVDPDLETHVRKLQTETSAFPGFGPFQVLADHPDELRSIVISFYGPKSDVEALAKRIDVAALRRLLPG